jgi:alkyl sulfatase BDS1-like metallo-beta-lactamase superfamily hydrolase
MITKASTIFDDLLPQALSDHGDKARRINATFNFKIAGAGNWTVDTKTNPPTSRPGLIETSDCTVEISNADLVELANNQSLAMKFFFSGKLKVTGDPSKIQQIIAMVSEYAK